MKGSAQHYMAFDKALPSAQGMAIHGDRAFILYDSGYCGVYDLESKAASPLALFPLGSQNDGIPTPEYRNHANSCMFSHTHWMGNPIPLLYVTIGSGIGTDEDGFFYRCAVENIVCTKTEAGEVYHAETMQVISYRPGNTPEDFLEPCWGCPCFLLSPKDNKLYIFSAKYRTKRGCVPEGAHNRFIITAFPLPQVTGGETLILEAKDILHQFSVESDIAFTQGGTICADKLYYTFGLPKKEYPLHVAVFDLKRCCMEADYTDMDADFRGEELECCDFYRGKLLCNTNGGNLYTLEGPTNEQPI